jgi:hypothetical protein
MSTAWPVSVSGSRPAGKRRSWKCGTRTSSCPSRTSPVSTTKAAAVSCWLRLWPGAGAGIWQTTGSNSDRSARSARSSSSAAAAAGSIPERGRTRPRYLITSARVQVLLSCCASATAFCAARASSSFVRTGPSAPCGCAAGCAVPHRRRDGRQAHANCARELFRPARVQLREIKRPLFRGACLEVGRLREPCEFALGRLASVLLLELRGAGTQVGGDGLAAGGEHAHHGAADALDLEAVAVIARGPLEAEPAGERFFEVLGDDRADGADVLVVAQGIRGAPFPVGGGLGDVGDLGVDVQLHVPVAGGVLQPVRHGQIGLVPLAGLAAMYPGVVRAGPIGPAGTGSWSRRPAPPAGAAPPGPHLARARSTSARPYRYPAPRPAR